MKSKYFIIFIGLLLFLATSKLTFATPSTQIWNPSTDIQAYNTVHFGIDNYFNPLTSMLPVDVGLTYGLTPGLEIGIDAFYPQNSPLAFNMKYGIPEKNDFPAYAIGLFGFGTQQGITDQNVVYALLAKTIYVNQFSIGRFSAGGFWGNKQVLVNPENKSDNTGVMLTWDRVINDKLWVCIDYSSTRSSLGALFYGLSWNFSPNTSVIFGYGTFNNGGNQTYTLQLDVNI
ncbi:MAG: hypothetical protein WC860_03240 [Candidatus Margulisiibacteriota bacterium]